METIKVDKYTFELIEKIPKGYDIWNIGKHMINGYLPLCQCDKDYHVNTDTLKAIKYDDAQQIMRWCVSAHTEREYKIRFNKIAERFNY